MVVERDEPRGRSPRDLEALIEAERTGLPFVCWRNDAGEQQILSLTPMRARITVGRREHSDIALIALCRPIAEDRSSEAGRYGPPRSRNLPRHEAGNFWGRGDAKGSRLRRERRPR